MSRVFLSKSTQIHNEYTGGSTEAIQMDAVVDLVPPLLRAEGHEVEVGEGKSWQEQVALGNKFMGATGRYYAIHSNAGGGDGTVAFYHSGSVAGKRMAERLYARVAPVSVGRDDGVKPNDGLGEINGPKSPACLIELEFHDNAAGAHDIRSRHSAYAHAIADGILDEVGRKPVAKPTVRLSCSKKNANRLEGYVLSGVTYPMARVILSYRRPGETLWRPWVELTANAAGGFSVGTRGYRVGTYRYRAMSPANVKLNFPIWRYGYAEVGIV